MQAVNAPASSVPPNQRIAVFDLDGTLWTEQPLPAQLVFFRDRYTDFALLMATGGIPIEQYTQMVERWLETAKQPCFQRLYSDLAYKPMLELLGYMRKNGFKTYIVSGSGIEFIRTFSEKAFGVPPEQVIGSIATTDFETGEDGKPVLKLIGWPSSIDDGKRKVVSINQFIGRRPLAVFGNSDGDQQMLEWTAAGDGPRLMLLVHHTDATREYKYDKDSHNGRLGDRTLNEVRNNSGKVPKHWWIVVDVQKDWNTMYPTPNIAQNGYATCHAK
jgi:phosphoserine phosphatase